MVRPQVIENLREGGVVRLCRGGAGGAARAELLLQRRTSDYRRRDDDDLASSPVVEPLLKNTQSIRDVVRPNVDVENGLRYPYSRVAGTERLVGPRPDDPEIADLFLKRLRV